MVATWIESASRGRHGGPVRAGLWAALVVGTHPVEADQEVWLEIAADDVPLGPLPAYWIENKGVNSFWHVPIPPQGVGARLRYRSGARRGGSGPVFSPFQDVVVRPNLPDRTDAGEPVTVGPEGLVGNRMMTARVDPRGSTYDVYFPTVGLHSDVRPAEGDLPQSRSHFRAIVGGLALGRRLDWFSERLTWDAFQHYQGATNLLATELSWRRGPIRVVGIDFIALGPDLPQTAGGTESPGQYLKRFRIYNDGPVALPAVFGLHVQAEVNGGIGEPGLSWHDGDRTLLATNRGHGHANRKLARDATVEFAVALDGRGDVICEPTGPNEAILMRRLELPPGGFVAVDVLVSGAFTGWRGDPGTFEHWLRPALAWFRAADLDRIERDTAAAWDDFVEPLPTLDFRAPKYGIALRRSALAAALHADAKWGSIASGFDRGLHAYCWPRDAIGTAAALDRAGHPEVGHGVYEWLGRVRGQARPYAYWFQKYTIDGWPEWETPALDQSAMLPRGLEHHYRQTGDLAFVAQCWPSVEQAAAVCGGDAGHPGLRALEGLDLVSSAGIWDNRYGAFLYSNACAVAGLRAAVRLGRALDKPEEVLAPWQELADRIWERGILSTPVSDDGADPGLVDPATGRFLDARRLSTRRALWSDRPETLIERSAAVDISLLGPAVPLGLLPAADPRVRLAAEAILRHNAAAKDPHALTCWSDDPAGVVPQRAPSEAHRQDFSSLATLWMARYLIALGRETGQGRHWTHALTMLDNLIARLGPLGLSLRRGSRSGEPPRPDQGVWGLHAMLIEALLDIAGFDYDAPDRRLSLRPALPPAWGDIGMSRPFPFGHATYRLERAGGADAYRLSIKARLDQPVTLQAELTCPGLSSLGPWTATPEAPPPAFDPGRALLSWEVELPAGESRREWTWGPGPRPAASSRTVNAVAAPGG